MKFQELRLLPLFIIVTLLFAFSLAFPKHLLATSGCCSGHSGVNCAAGAQANGNVICNDGWRGSSCSYASMVMCGGSTTPVPVIYTPRPTIKPAITPVPTPMETPIPAQTPKQTSSSGISNPTPTPVPLTIGEVIGVLAFLAVVTGLPIWIIIKIVKKFRK